MKRKGARDIPDFSHKRPSAPMDHGHPPESRALGAKPPTPRAPAPKPQATSAKSGRRGQ